MFNFRSLRKGSERGTTIAQFRRSTATLSTVFNPMWSLLSVCRHSLALTHSVSELEVLTLAFSSCLWAANSTGHCGSEPKWARSGELATVGRDVTMWRTWASVLRVRRPSGRSVEGGKDVDFLDPWPCSQQDAARACADGLPRKHVLNTALCLSCLHIYLWTVLSAFFCGSATYFR